MEMVEVMRWAISLVTPIVWGIFIVLLNRLHTSNVDRLQRIEDRLIHLDGCVDGIKDRAVRAMELDDVRLRVTRLENRILSNAK